MGYDAYKSGLSMMPRGVGALTAMVLCATLANVIDNRILVMIGLGCIAGGSWMLGDLNLQISTMNIAIPNFLFGVGLGLAMIPIITLSVATIKNEQMTNASGLQNLLKNIGGAFGTSIVATLLSRGAQKHQYMLINHLTDTYQPFVERVHAMAGAFSSTVDLHTANYMGQHMVYRLLQQQANLSAFIDAFRVFAVASALTIPLILLLKNIKKKHNKASGEVLSSLRRKSFSNNYCIIFFFLMLQCVFRIFCILFNKLYILFFEFFNFCS